MTLPEGYKEDITRVTSLVSFLFPFKGTDGERRYLEWLAKHKLCPKFYVETACSMWTEVHEALENYIEKRPSTPCSDDVKTEIGHGKKWLDELNYQSIETELYVREKNERFQGAVDLLYTDKNWKVVLADWKTFGICKKRFNLPNKFVVATDKKKKVRLQMSIYAYALKQQGIIVDRLELLFLHEDGIKVVEMELHDDKEIENLLLSYEASLKASPDLKVNLSQMYKIEVTVPTIQFGNVRMTMDLEKIDNGKVTEENIEQFMKSAQYTRQQYIKHIT